MSGTLIKTSLFLYSVDAEPQAHYAKVMPNQRLTPTPDYEAVIFFAKKYLCYIWYFHHVYNSTSDQL